MPCLDKMKVGTIFRLFKRTCRGPTGRTSNLLRLQHANFFGGDAEYIEFTPGTDDFRRELRRTTAALATSSGECVRGRKKCLWRVRRRT